MAASLIYLSYGAGPHEAEAVFSILSARLLLPPDSPTKIIVYTDDPAPYENLDVTIEYVSPRTFQEWLGPHGATHRRKIIAHQHALAKYGSCAMIDGDTYFIQSPDVLLDRLSPRQSVMHICEGPLKHLREHEYNMLAMTRAPYLVGGKSWRFSPEWRMWCAGITGVHASNAFLMDEALRLCDAMRQRDGINVCSQTSIGRVLGESTRIVGCTDVIFHYWRAYLRDPFRRHLGELLPRIASLPLMERAEVAYAHRPRPDWRHSIRSSAKRLLHSAGLTRVGLVSNG